MKRYEILEWDSDFFGFSVARIVPDELDYNNLKEVLAEMKKEKVSLAYWASCRTDEYSRKMAEDLGGFLTEKKITYLIILESLNKKSLRFADMVEIYKDDKPNSDLEKLIIEGGVYSRFYVDPKISREKYEALHKLWIANSTNKSIAKAVLIIRKHSRIVGFVSLGEKTGRGNIVYIAVDANIRGKGLGGALMNSAHSWFISNGYKYAQAETQEANIIACRMYEKFGYNIDKVQNFYHFWL
jgi:ribosomal protein S18 acetylase RimI-like enzyme